MKWEFVSFPANKCDDPMKFNELTYFKLKWYRTLITHY